MTLALFLSHLFAPLAQGSNWHFLPHRRQRPTSANGVTLTVLPLAAHRGKMTQIDRVARARWGVASPTRYSAAMSPRRLGRLLFPQPRLAQAFHMQLVHPLVAETVLAKERK